jgi:hypothetical protein
MSSMIYLDKLEPFIRILVHPVCEKRACHRAVDDKMQKVMAEMEGASASMDEMFPVWIWKYFGTFLALIAFLILIAWLTIVGRRESEVCSGKTWPMWQKRGFDEMCKM